VKTNVLMCVSIISTITFFHKIISQLVPRDLSGGYVRRILCSLKKSANLDTKYSLVLDVFTYVTYSHVHVKSSNSVIIAKENFLHTYVGPVCTACTYVYPNTAEKIQKGIRCVIHLCTKLI
jgi:hypothetical protein